jgi:putative transposase
VIDPSGRRPGKAACIRRNSPFHTGPYKSLDDVEYATLSWVDWYNNERLYEDLGYIPPAEYEANHYALQPAQQHATITN